MCLPVRYMRKIDPDALEKLLAAEKLCNSNKERAAPNPCLKNAQKQK